VAPLDLPASGAGDDGIIDLGNQGAALICQALAISFGLRTQAGQHALVVAFGRTSTAWPPRSRGAVPGCCRCVTRPPATTVARSGAVASASAGRTPRSAATGNGTGLMIVEAGTSRPAGWLDSTFASHRSS
jgi:hypothetical protein